MARTLSVFLRRSGVIEVLREGPPVPFEVGDLVAPVAGMYLKLGDDHRSQRLGVHVVTLDVVDVDVEHAADPATRTVTVNRGPADRDQTVQHLHLGPARLAIGFGVMRRRALLKSEHLGQPGDRSVHVVIDQMRQDPRKARGRIRSGRVSWWGAQ